MLFRSRTIRESVAETIVEVGEGGKVKMLLAAGRLRDFRCVLAEVRKVGRKGLGISRETAELLAGLLTHGITPVVHEYGSLGCSGDLAPLAHCALVLMGEGEAVDEKGSSVPVSELLARHGIAPVELMEKEGLALIKIGRAHV